MLFDNDGVLVTPPADETQAAATRDAFRAVGVDAVAQHHLDAIVSGVTVADLSEICTTYDLEAETFWNAREHHDARSQRQAFRTGDRDCYDDVDCLSALSQNCGVVSNNHHSTLAFVLERFDLEPLFETYYGREKTIESLQLKKPNPHYIERALSDLDGDSALYVGDSESDLIAADRAGIDSVFVRRPHCRNTDLDVTPTYDVETLRDVVRIADGHSVDESRAR
ncbi:HAD family hydrolase [Natrinema altunense]|uniref:HAD family hydrolase n=1 Tax=Natrinema altunense TaxID=222984 RepID=A0A482Y0J1_9EURY|nr:HAD-IA family hydrolase [Natrinema altunense]RZH67256.1 HAD family hydrolase [Natrinema altunense]